MSAAWTAAPTASSPNPARRLQRRTWAGTALAGVLAVTSLATTGAAASVVVTRTATVSPAFYQPPSPLPDGRDGALIRHETISPALSVGGVLARAERVMYLSRDAHDRRVAVTGTVLTPTSSWQGSGPRPLIGYAVGTQGMADRCAPSREVVEGGPEYETPNLARLLGHGYSVTMTDYQGLGTPGSHTYLNTIAEAHAVLDSIRAARRLPSAGLSTRGPVGVMGYSQGGGAAAAAAELQPSYAPGLRLAGVYAGGVPANPISLMRKLDGGEAAGLEPDFLTGLKKAYPHLPVDGLLNDRGRQLAAQTADECMLETILKHALMSTSTLTRDGRSIAAHLAEPPFRKVMHSLTLGRRMPTAPVLVLEGTQDELVPYRSAAVMARGWCRLGASVRFEPLTAPTHVAGWSEGFVRATDWMADRLSGKPATSNCGQF